MSDGLTEVFMKKFKKIISIIMIAAVIASVAVVSTVSTSASGTGAGLAEWALNAYYSGWSYVWGGDSPGAVDCSGLITSYCGGNRTTMLDDAKANGRDWGYVSNGIPNVHGLGLSRPNHVGVYIGDNMEVDARGSDYGVCYDEIGGWNNWTCWFKLTAITYTYSGWEEFNGDSYYYENGEYITNTSRTIDGVTYSFDSKGRSISAPSSYTSTSSSSSSKSSSSSSSNDTGALKKGSTGSRVEKLQTRLQELGYYTGSVDGDFGANTEKAFKLFQQTAGLYVDGIAGSDADALYADDAPYYVSETKKAETKTEDEDEDDEIVVTKKSETALAETGTGETAEAKAEETAMKFAKGDFSDDVALVQEKLISLGYLTGSADGDFGAKTEEAVKAFQTANGLTVTGTIEPDTYDKLFSETAVKAAAKTETEEKKSEDAITGNLPKTVAAASVSPAQTNTGKTSSAPNTDVEVSNSQMSSKAVAAVAESPIFRRGANATNFEFLLWLAVMIVVMLIAFTVVYVIEKKRQRKAYSARRFS